MKRGKPLQTRTPLRAKKGLSSRTAPIAVRPMARTRAKKQPGVDKAELAIGAVKRHRSGPHMAFVATLPCCAAGCGVKPVTVHHLTHAQPKARGLKSGDQWTVPLCPAHHQNSAGAVHQWTGPGGEAGWWAAQGVDPIALAEQLWGQTRA